MLNNKYFLQFPGSMENHLGILIVDDVMSWHQVAEAAIEKGKRRLGYDSVEVFNAYTIKNGLELLRDKNPGAVLLDINFDEQNKKNQDGIDQFLVPARAVGIEVPILCWSTDMSFRWVARRSGADDFLSKSQAKYGSHLVDALDTVIYVRRHHQP
jgi:DNA-binding NarL/FixJ family response regulator